MDQSYFHMGAKIAEYLRKYQTEEGSVHDIYLKRKTPDSQYGHTFFGLACILMYKRTGETYWLRSGLKPLNYFLSIPNWIPRARSGIKSLTI